MGCFALVSFFGVSAELYRLGKNQDFAFWERAQDFTGYGKTVLLLLRIGVVFWD
jgi:hypothetical protein